MKKPTSAKSASYSAEEAIKRLRALHSKPPKKGSSQSSRSIKKDKPSDCHLDQMIRISIHPTELKFESKAIRKWVKENASIEIYPKGLRRGKRFDKATEFRARVREYLKEIEKNKGKESNIEGIIVDMLIELLHRMMLQDIRKLNLWKLV